MELVNELPFQDPFQGKRCGFVFRQFWNSNGKHKKHGHPQRIALLTILKKMSKTHHFNKKLKSNFTHKTFILTWSLTKHIKNTKHMDINRQLHFSPFSKAWVKPITLATFSKLTSLTKKNIFIQTLCTTFNKHSTRWKLFKIKTTLSIKWNKWPSFCMP